MISFRAKDRFVQPWVCVRACRLSSYNWTLDPPSVVWRDLCLFTYIRVNWSPTQGQRCEIVVCGKLLDVGHTLKHSKVSVSVHIAFGWCCLNFSVGTVGMNAVCFLCTSFIWKFECEFVVEFACDQEYRSALCVCMFCHRLLFPVSELD